MDKKYIDNEVSFKTMHIGRIKNIRSTVDFDLCNSKNISTKQCVYGIESLDIKAGNVARNVLTENIVIDSCHFAEADVAVDNLNFTHVINEDEVYSTNGGDIRENEDPLKGLDTKKNTEEYIHFKNFESILSGVCIERGVDIDNVESSTNIDGRVDFDNLESPMNIDRGVDIDNLESAMNIERGEEDINGSRSVGYAEGIDVEDHNLDYPKMVNDRNDNFAETINCEDVDISDTVDNGNVEILGNMEVENYDSCETNNGSNVHFFETIKEPFEFSITSLALYEYPNDSETIYDENVAVSEAVDFENLDLSKKNVDNEHFDDIKTGGGGEYDKKGGGGQGEGEEVNNDVNMTLIECTSTEDVSIDSNVEPCLDNDETDVDVYGESCIWERKSLSSIIDAQLHIIKCAAASTLHYGEGDILESTTTPNRSLRVSLDICCVDDLNITTETVVGGMLKVMEGDGSDSAETCLWGISLPKASDVDLHVPGCEYMTSLCQNMTPICDEMTQVINDISPVCDVTIDVSCNVESFSVGQNNLNLFDHETISLHDDSPTEFLNQDVIDSKLSQQKLADGKLPEISLSCDTLSQLRRSSRHPMQKSARLQLNLLSDTPDRANSATNYLAKEDRTKLFLSSIHSGRSKDWTSWKSDEWLYGGERLAPKPRFKKKVCRLKTAGCDKVRRRPAKKRSEEPLWLCQRRAARLRSCFVSLERISLKGNMSVNVGEVEHYICCTAASCRTNSSEITDTDSLNRSNDGVSINTSRSNLGHFVFDSPCDSLDIDSDCESIDSVMSSVDSSMDIIK